jgi:aromatic-amino-acid transaminase
MSLFTAVEMAPRDPILGLNEQFAADTNPNKVNLGVGVYFDDNGKLPLLQCVQAAEKAMMEKPTARGYLPIDGIAAYDKLPSRAWFSVPIPTWSRAAAWPRCRPSAAPAA